MNTHHCKSLRRHCGRYGGALDERGTRRMLDSTGRRRCSRAGRAHRCHHCPGCDDRRGQSDRCGRRRPGPHHRHDRRAYPGADPRGPRVAGRSVLAGQTLIVLDGDDLAAGARAARAAAARRRTGCEGGRGRASGGGRWPGPRTRRPTIASPACRPSAPPPHRNSMMPLARCGAPRRASSVRPREHCRPHPQSRAPAPPATRRAPPTPSPRSRRLSTA